jgi:pimeloyl-ACP methyl ester carboxylesterase
VFDPRPKLARCQLPVLVLHGAKDRTIPPREARENFDRVSHANKQWSLIRGRGHSDVLTDPAYFLALSRFISAVKGGPFPAPVRGAAGLGLDALLLTWWSRLRRLLRAN